MILIENGKGGKDRWVLYGQRAAEAIAEYQQWRPSVAGYLFEAPAQNGSFRIRGKSWYTEFYTQDGKKRSVKLGLKSALPTEEAAREQLRRLIVKLPEECRPVVHPARPYCARQVRYLVRALGQRAGVKGVHPHSFRRAMACHMLAGEASIRAIQELLGHKLLSTTQIYTT